MKCYKFTSPDRRTHRGFAWTPGDWAETSGIGDLCGPGWLHAYEQYPLAEFLNPIHGNFSDDALLWEAEADGNLRRDGALKFGATRLRVLTPLPRTIPTTGQYVCFGIAAAWCVGPNQAWKKVILEYLRSTTDAERAYAAYAAFAVVAASAARAAAYAAYAACREDENTGDAIANAALYAAQAAAARVARDAPLQAIAVYVLSHSPTELADYLESGGKFAEE